MAITLKELSEKWNVPFSGDETLELDHVSGLEKLKNGGVCFINNHKILESLPINFPIAVIVPPGINKNGYNLIIADDPLALHVQIANFFHSGPKISNKIHSSAVLGSNLKIGNNVTIDPHVVIYDNVVIEDDTVLRAGVVVMENSIIGKNCTLYPNVTIREDCHIGNRVIIHPGSVIGSDGYGYFQRCGIHHKIPQTGGVIIEDDVEIGGCCTIDRARFSNTIIRKGTKIDNLVHIAHNVEIGEHSLILGQVGIAGSTKTGHHLTMAGQSGIVEQVCVGNNVTALARTLITKSIGDNNVLGGNPSRPAKKWKHLQALNNRLDILFDRLKNLETKL